MSPLRHLTASPICSHPSYVTVGSFATLWGQAPAAETFTLLTAPIEQLQQVNASDGPALSANMAGAVGWLPPRRHFTPSCVIPATLTARKGLTGGNDTTVEVM